MFELNTAGVGELLKSAEMNSVLAEYSSMITARAGSGYESSPFTASTRSVTRIEAVDEKAMRDNMENNILLKLIKQSYD